MNLWPSDWQRALVATGLLNLLKILQKIATRQAQILTLHRTVTYEMGENLIFRCKAGCQNDRYLKGTVTNR
jgi:hypothetical protein